MRTIGDAMTSSNSIVMQMRGRGLLCKLGKNGGKNDGKVATIHHTLLIGWSHRYEN